MNESTIHRLNQVNRAFYCIVGVDYDASRRYARAGWSRVLAHVSARAEGLDQYRVLDVGCGNAHFGAYLAAALPIPLLYHGIDANAYLLGQAEQALTSAVLVQMDFIEAPDRLNQLGPAYHLVVFNNVLHHIPAFALRKRLLLDCAGKLVAGGLLVFTAWQFLLKPKWPARVVPWSTFPDIDTAQLEPGDYLLDWLRGERAIRYCHFIDDDEFRALLDALAASGLTTVDTFFADGKEGDLNRYAVLEQR